MLDICVNSLTATKVFYVNKRDHSVMKPSSLNNFPFFWHNEDNTIDFLDMRQHFKGQVGTQATMDVLMYNKDGSGCVDKTI